MATSNSRLMARISIMSFTIVILSLILIVIFDIRNSYTFTLLIISNTVAMTIKFFVLRCQACGTRGGVPQWKKNKTIHCPKCGTAYEYDY